MRTIHHQRGASMLDALLAGLLLCGGLLACVRLMPELQRATELARQRTEAARLAQEEIERLRFDSAPVESAAARTIAPDGSFAASTTYELARSTAELPFGRARAVEVRVRWTDRDGSPRELLVATLRTATDPALPGMLAQRR